MKRLVVGAIALALCAATPARADWQFTKWGMTKEEFKKVSPVAVAETMPKCTSPHLASNWEAGNIKFTNCYNFGEKNQLEQVFLHLEDYSQKQVLYQALVTKYGEPVVDDSLEVIGLVFYKWRSEKDLIRLFDYSPSRKMYFDYMKLDSTLEMQTEQKL